MRPFIYRAPRIAIPLLAWLALTLAAHAADEAWVIQTGPIADRAEIDALATWLDIWKVEPDGRLIIRVDADELARLQELGYAVEIDAERTDQLARVGVPLPEQGSGIPGFPCYRTVEETFATAEALAASNPELIEWIDVGDSWEKTQDPSDGYDLQVLRFGKPPISVHDSERQGLEQQPPLAIPSLFVNTAIHAREYTTAELSTRFAEMLAAGYGTDPDITWLLDHQWIHLLLHANPDGRKQAETGISWRKNANNDYCPNTNDRGADLNRNFQFGWGCCGGSSSNECSTTFRGASAASEPETQAIQDYASGIFFDVRPDDQSIPAPNDTMGILLDVHSFGEDVLWSWGFTTTQPPEPNGSQLYSLGRKYGFYANYRPQHGSFSTVDGATKDFAYGTLGIPGFTIELGTTFFESCTVFENDILQANLNALLYMAKASRAPYLLPAGPEPYAVAVNPSAVEGGDLVVLTATVDDTRFTTLNGTEPSQPILSAQAYVDTPPWQDGASAIPMSASDGVFNAVAENVELLLDTSSLAPGRHLLFVEATDVAGNTGVVSAVFLDIEGAIFDDDFESGDLSAWTLALP